MTEAKKPAARAKAKKPAKKIADKPEAAPFTLAEKDIPEAFREFTDKGIANAKETYSKFRDAAEDATDVVEETINTTRRGVVDWNLLVIDNAKTSTDATFALLRDMCMVTSVAEAVELQSTYARAQFDLFNEQSRELRELGSSFANEVAKPAKSAFSKAFDTVKAA